MRLFIGLMSGTSMDGVDAALIDVDTNRLIHGIIRPYSSEAKRLLDKLLTNVGWALAQQTNTVLGHEFADAVLQLLHQAKLSNNDVIAIGSHGQTICHNVDTEIPYTVQLACPHIIAEKTGIDVVADFRTRDLVLGGKGAPYAPMYHRILFADHELPLAVVNIGGIANVSFLVPPQVRHPERVFLREGSPYESSDVSSGYDTGPGNCLMDFWTKKHLGLDYDASGEWAATGKLIPELLENFLKDDYFKKPSPKSIGKEYFSHAWLEKYLSGNEAAQDVQATLLALTATTISHAILTHDQTFKNVLLCGGGAHNLSLLRQLSSHLPNANVQSTSNIGINPDFIEAMMFAWMAEKALNKKKLNFSSITGAKKSGVYGVVYHA